jgi:hypothetical protein
MPIRSNPKLKYVSLSELVSFVTFGVFKPYTDISFNSGRSEDLDLIVKFNKQIDEAKRDIFSALRDGHLFGRGRFSRTKASSGPNWNEISWHEYEIAKTDIEPDFWSEIGIDWKSSSAKNPGGEFVDIVFSTDEIFAVWSPDPMIASSNSVPASDRIVSLDDNSAAYREAVGALDAAISEAEKSNSLGDLTAGERVSVLSQLKTGRTLFNEKTIRVSAYKAVLEPAMKWLLDKCADNAVGLAITAAITAIGTLLGFAG